MLHMSKIAALWVASFVLVSNALADEMFEPKEFSDYVADPQNGERIFDAAGCASCHSVEGDADLLAGGQAISTKFGELYAPNITADPENGIGAWSNAEFLNAVLGGVSPAGRDYFGAVFPYPAYARMTPEDALDLRAHMATLAVSDSNSKEHNISYVSQKILRRWSGTRDALPAVSNPQLRRGQYLVEAVGHCAECHTPRDTGFGFKYDLDSDNAFMGEIGILGGYAPEISATRLNTFGAEAFDNALVQAQKLNGKPMSATSMRRIARHTSRLPADDRAAMFAYLTGAPVEASMFATLASLNATTSAPETIAEILEVLDTTNAPRLVARIDAYCEAQGPATAGAAPKPAAAANDLGEPTLMSQADEVIEEHCRSCHAPGKTYAAVFPTGDIADMPFDARIVVAGNADASPLFESIASNRMPLGKKMTSAEVDTLKRWIETLGQKIAAPVTETREAKAAPTVSLPHFAGGTRHERMLAIVADISDADERDRAFYRYFSFANTPLSAVDCNLTGAGRNPMFYLHAAFNKYINSVSLSPRVVPVTPISGTEGAIVRIDMRDYGWTTQMWESLSSAEYNETAARSGFSPEAWRDLATVYPYGIDPSVDPMLAVVANAAQTPVPVLRADWVAHFGSRAPYYDMFLGLTAQIGDLEARLGLNVEEEIQAGRIIRAGILPGSSGVSDHNRMLERFDLSSNGYYWKSYDFAGDVNRQSLTLYPDGPEGMSHTATQTEAFEHDGGEMIFSLPNGLQGYYLSTNKGERLLVGPASIVSFRTKAIGKGVEIENARSCFDCHANGLIAKSDQMRDIIKASKRFSPEESDILADFYIDNEQLSEIYKQDSNVFLTALSRLNATERSPTGRLTSLAAPISAGGGEIFTYLADQHFDSLDLNGLAREFQMNTDTLRTRLEGLRDPQLTTVLSDWISRLDAGAKLHRSELDTYYSELLPRLTNLRTMTSVDRFQVTQQKSGSYETSADAAIVQSATRFEGKFSANETADLSYEIGPTFPNDRLTLALTVPQTNVRVNDLLTFEIVASKTCELQVFYVEESKSIEELPQEILGPNFLEAGETRQIPYAASGLQLRFDTVGTGETMLAFCREGGLRGKRMTSQEVLEFAHTRAQPLTRGISIEAASRVQNDNGSSATNHVTFNVSQ